MEKNTFIRIWDYPVYVLDSSLNIYAEYDKFNRFNIAGDLPAEERKEVFVDLLIRNKKVNQPEDISEIPSDIPSYLGWAIVATADDIDLLQRALKPECWDAMSQYHREMFATGYHQTVFKEAQFSQNVYLQWLADESVGDLESKQMVIFRSYMEDIRNKAIKKQGFAIQNVCSDEAWKTYSYTISASEKLGYDVVMVNAGPDSGHHLAELVSGAIKEGGFKLDEPFIDAKYHITGEPMRAVAKELGMESPAVTRMQGAVNAGMKRVVQIYIGDKNNRLPGEEGYDTNFVQELTADTPE